MSIYSAETILRVAVNTPLRRSFDYLLPDNCCVAKLTAGVRIEVPFGSRKLIGLLLAVDSGSEISKEKLRRAIRVLDEQPLLSPQLMRLCGWVGDYYHHPVGEVFLGALPKLLRDGRSYDKFFSGQATPAWLAQPQDFLVTLNKHQQRAVNAINDANGFAVFLLNGVTGSGKTEVYMRAIDAVIRRGQQALILVPEIGLTPQTVIRFQRRFPVDIAVFHSKLTEKQRLETWMQAKQGMTPIVIGTRSAIFSPLPNLGMIVVDEEHDLSFKQQSGLRYSAKNLAVMRAKFENIPLILGSATPALESLHNVQRKSFVNLSLPERAGSAVHPDFYLIDLRGKKLVDGLSLQLIDKIRVHLNNNGQVLVFLNRRGYAPAMLCQDCGWAAECERCDARLTVHQSPRMLYCHHCNRTKPIYKTCPRCGSEKVIALGVGTERLEEKLQELFLDVSIVRVDRDSTRGNGGMQRNLDTINDGGSCILVGTQMLAKGHHFPNVTLAAILNIDNGLFSPDFRAPEYVAQLVVQVAGRAGRAEKLGEVYIQTYNPHHPLLLNLIDYGYQNFADGALSERRLAGLPPYTFFALVRADAKQCKHADDFLSRMRELSEQINVNGVRVLGPISAPLHRKKGRYHAQLLISSRDRRSLHQLLDKLVLVINEISSCSRVHWSLDVDPVDMF